MKKPMKDRIGDFMAGKGFYIVLFLCVAAIGISGYYLFSSMSQDPGADAPVAGRITVTVTPTPTTAPAPTQAPALVPERPVIADTPRVSAKPTQTPQPTPEPTPEPSAPPAALVFTWPVKGEVLSGFSVETLAYDVTMGDWRTHMGLDIAAEAGLQVRATAAGTVSAVEQDPLMGCTVAISHADGLTSIYANLAEDIPVEVGDEVFTGDAIGTVGASAKAESALPSHLHFALMKNDLPTDPGAFLPEQY